MIKTEAVELKPMSRARKGRHGSIPILGSDSLSSLCKGYQRHLVSLHEDMSIIASVTTWITAFRIDPIQLRKAQRFTHLFDSYHLAWTAPIGLLVFQRSRS